VREALADAGVQGMTVPSARFRGRKALPSCTAAPNTRRPAAQDQDRGGVGAETVDKAIEAIQKAAKTARIATARFSSTI